MKRLRFRDGDLDGIDAALLRALATDGRATMADLAKVVGLSAPSVAERVRRLEEAGIIRGYGAVIDPAALGRPLTAMLRIRPIPGQLPQAVTAIERASAIVSCDRVTGEDCLVARAHLRDVSELEALIDAIIPYAMTNTAIVQSSPVAPRLPPIARDGEEAPPAPRRERRRRG